MKPQLLYLTEWVAVCILFIPYPGRGQNISSYPANKLIHTKDTMICAGSPVPLHTVPMLSFIWQPTAYLNDPASADPVADPPVTTRYILTAMAPTDNLIRNGDFSSGNTGFYSDYAYTRVHNGEGEYFVGPSAYAWSSKVFPFCSVNTDSNNNMLMLNGSKTANMKVWSQRVSVLPNGIYAFSFRAQSITNGNPAALQLSINGIPLGTPFQLNPASCIWRQFDTTWDSGSDTTALLSLVDTNTIASSNDFALDDMSFMLIGPFKDSITISANPNPLIQVEKSHDIDCTTPVTELYATGAVYYTWTPVKGLDDAASAHPSVSIDSTTTYIVKGEDSTGCAAYSQITVKVSTQGKPEFVLPNAFTPNGDGHNDCFGVRNWGDVDVEEFSIFNREGQLLFTTRSRAGCWDGTFKGSPQPPGVYIYVIRAKSFCCPILRTGTVILVR
jgi:gliding motility-associated-like protein